MLCLPAVTLGGKVQKRNNGLCQFICIRERFPPVLVLMPDISVSPHLSLMTSNLLLPCWSSEGVSPSKSVCGPFKRNCLDSGSFFLPQPQSLLVFTARSYGDLSFWHWNPGLGVLVWGWDPLFLRYSSRFLSSTRGCGIVLFCNFTPPTSFRVLSSLIP